MIYQLKVTLSDSEPPIWRRFVIDGQISLGDLHSVIQLVMGWTDSHLHHFIVDDSYYGLQDPELFDEGPGTLDEQRFTLAQVAPGPGGSFEYEYDFGDSWEHIIEVEGIAEPAAGVSNPRCLAGERSCPPEDVGGIWGYEGFLEALRDVDHPEHTAYMEWVSDFDPERFDVEGANDRLSNLGQLATGRRTGATYTAKQGQYLAFIYYYTKLNAMPPAQSDIQRYFGITGPTVNAMLKTLEKAGFISRVARQPRSIKLLLRREELPDLE
jgi:hypothetical protein